MDLRIIGHTGEENGMNREHLHLYFVAGTPNCLKSIHETLEEAIQAGITMFQFREKGPNALTGTAKEQCARELLAICRRHNIPCMINDDVQLALEIDADGVHIGQDDTTYEEARRILGPSKIIGVSTHNMDEIQEAVMRHADYIGVGAMFPTLTKHDVVYHDGPRLIETARRRGMKIPIVGIGGISEENANQVRLAGADGIAVVSSISLAQNIQQAVNRLL